MNTMRTMATGIASLVILWMSPALSAVGPGPQDRPGDPLVGIWQGTVTGKPGTFQIFFSIEKKGPCVYAATVDIPAQNARNIPVTGVRWTSPDLFLDMSSFGITFQGRMEANRLQISGRFRVGDVDLALVLSPAAAVPEMHRPQDPEKPYPYDEIEVSFPNPEAGIDLSGTLTVPPGKGPFPAAVLISGSGPQDRDSTLAGHRTFLVLADSLTRRGMAVLRYDDRGCGRSGGDFHKATTADFASDAGAAWEFLRRQPRIDAKHIGLIGHSEGAWAGSMFAACRRDVAFLVLMAGPGIPGDRILLTQTAALSRARGASEEAVRKEGLMYGRFLKAIREQPDAGRAEAEMNGIAAEALAAMSEAERKELRADEASLAQSIREIIADYPWSRFLASHDPAEALRQVRCPLLALNGDKDTQVLPDINLEGIGRALREGGNPRFELRSLPGLNHLFQTALTGDPREYGKIEETLSPTVLQLVGEWILGQPRQDGSTGSAAANGN